MKNNKITKQNRINLINTSIETLNLNYTNIVNQDIKNGTFIINDKLIHVAQTYFSNLNIKFNLLKSPRREDDAVIFLIETLDSRFCLKVLPDVWISTAEHIRYHGNLSKMSKSKYLPNIHFSDLDTINESILYLYDYIDGVLLSKILIDASVEQKKEILKALAKCINDLVLTFGLDINFDDGLDNFIVNPLKLSDISLTDLNIAFQALEVVTKKDLLRMVKKRALRSLSANGFDRIDVYSALYK